MKEYEYRRRLFYSFCPEWSFSDDIRNFDGTVFDESTRIEDAITYLLDGTSYLRFPGTARAVAIAAAIIISEEFDEDFFDVLNDPNLMNGYDPHFATYDQDKETYDAIISSVPKEKINWDSERMGITKVLICEEYMIDDKGLELLPRE
jgi:hypothetical protein